jgi:transcriptional regulator with XRE-family HTH domain
MSHVNSLGEYLRVARIETGDSLRGLAEKMQIAPSYLSDIENDRRVPADDVLKRFSELLHRDWDELLARAGRLDEESERLIRDQLRKQPDAVKLFRKIAGAHLTSEDIRRLSDNVPDPS